MIPIIAVTAAARNSRRKRNIYRGSDKFFDKCFMYTIVGFVCLFGILAIL